MSKQTTLDRTQRQTIDIFLSGYNLFITGSAGTGKSFLVKQLIKNYNINNPDNIEGMSVTSTTGLSSLNINGRTIHSWSGITPKQDLDDISGFVASTKQNHKRLNNWLYTKVLVIDEISMLEAKLLDFLDSAAKLIRNNEKPFGGIQMILTGDFYQLPPVCKGIFCNIPFCFTADCWDNLIDFTICLKKNHRQAEKRLVKFLNYVRKGEVNDYVRDELNQYHNNVNYNDDYTHLYPNVASVDKHNMLKLDQLTGEITNYTAKLITKPGKPSDFNNFPRDSVIAENLTLKPGAFIILNKNIDPEKGLVNGRQGIFRGTNPNGNAIIKTSDGVIHHINKARWEFPNFYVEQYPLRLAWALTIHKSQGMGIERLSVDIGGSIFSDGQVYVALSRAVNQKYLHIKNYEIRSITANSQVNQFYDHLTERSKQWNKSLADDGKICYENILNGFVSWKLPDGDVVVKDLTEEKGGTRGVSGEQGGDDGGEVSIHTIDKSTTERIIEGLRDKSKNDIIQFMMGLNNKEVMLKLDDYVGNGNGNGNGKSIKTTSKTTSKTLTENKSDKPKKTNTISHRQEDLCNICKENKHQNDYFNFLDEHICSSCCTTNPDYRLMNKQELYTYFKGKVRQRDINDILKECLYKPQKNLVNPRFKPTRLFMLGHIKKAVANL